MTRRTMAERKRRQAERDIRRDALLVLLSRMHRGALLDNERPLLRAHVEVEVREADELRRTVQGQQTAIQAAHDRTAAAEEAIREQEQRAVDAEEQLRMYRAVYGEGSAAAVDQLRDALARVDACERFTEAAGTRAWEAEQRAEQAEAEAATLRAAQPGNGRLYDYAKQAEAEAERYKADHLGACETVAAMHAAAVGEVRGPLLGVVEDVANVRAAYEAQHARADTLDRLCREQRQRADDAEAALAEQRTTTVECLDASGAALSRALDRADNAEDAARTAIDNHGRAEAELATLREGIRQCGGDPTSVQNVYAQLRMRTNQWKAAEERAEQAEAALARVHRDAVRLGLAWRSARRDRRADRAAMAAELPLVEAVERVRALAARMRAGSPQGAAAIYADRIEQALAVDNEHQEQHA